VGAVAYRLQLPEGALIHNVFHISQLKPFSADYTPVYDCLPQVTDLMAVDTVAEVVVDRRLVKKGNTAIPQVKLTWVGLPSTTTTWEADLGGQMRQLGGKLELQQGEVSHLMVAPRTMMSADEAKGVFYIVLAYLCITFLRDTVEWACWPVTVIGNYMPGTILHRILRQVNHKNYAKAEG
jgi:hypothetical protein